MKKIILFISLIAATFASQANAGVSCNPASNTLPVMYIYTDQGADIVSTDDYIEAKFYIDTSNTDFEPEGSREEMIAMQIKGQGNYTWKDFDKKPYRLKLEKKKKLLNLTKDKNYTLLAHADDTDAFLRNTLGFALSRLLGLAYTPEQSPVELFLNDNYVGVYFLTDKIRVSEKRVNIVEQLEGETDPNLITGGWLLEIDNYEEDPSEQFRMIEKDDRWLLVTSHSPEIMSDEQYSYMYNYLYNTNKSIQEKGDWEKYIDVDTLVNFYMIQEIMGNQESFNGSCYMHKDRGNDTKLQFGPVWDFGSSLHWANGQHIYDSPLFGDVWIDDLVQFTSFKRQCVKRWSEIKESVYPTLKEESDNFISTISSAAACDCQKWPQYGNVNLEEKKNDVLKYLDERIKWLDSEWSTLDADDLFDSKDGMLVYPNPTTGVINIAGVNSLTEVYVIDMGGKIVRDLDPSEDSWNLNLDKGVYMLKAIDAEGSVYSSKITVY